MSQTVRKYVIFVSLIVALALVYLFSSCSSETDQAEPPSVPEDTLYTIWYCQSPVNLGYRIKMFSPESGIAISRGRGEEKGVFYRYEKGSWIPVFDYSYSDYPLIEPVDSLHNWVLIHQSHDNFYKPRLFELAGNNKKEIPLPELMWDETDFLMWKGLVRQKDGTAWMVGQRGHILFFDGKKWKDFPSPAADKDNSNLMAGDINDIHMSSADEGWAVGREGRILHFAKGSWRIYNSPTGNELFRIEMVSRSLGFIVGEKGTILQFNGKSWEKVKTPVRTHLYAIKAADSSHVWIAGSRSVLLRYDKGRWLMNHSVKTFDDDFKDIDAIVNQNGEYDLWVMGDAGIYTTSQSLGFSFTDISEESSLRRNGRAGVFYDSDNDPSPELYVMNEDSPGLLFKNDGGNHYNEIVLQPSRRRSFNGVMAAAAGDINNDGYNDLLEISDNENYSLLLGVGEGRYKDYTVNSRLKLDYIDFSSTISARFADFNNDGNLDLYISNFNYPDMLFSNDGTGRFKNIYRETGIKKLIRHQSLGALLCDFNNDGLTDIFIPYRFAEKDRYYDLYINDGNFRFHQVDYPEFHLPSYFTPMTAAAADFNNDGFSDLIIFDQKTPPCLLINKSGAGFKDFSFKAGLTESIYYPDPSNGILGTADVNNDGWTDFYAGTKLFLNSPGCRFTEVSRQTGLNFTGNPAFADIDLDGDMDLFIGSSRTSLGKGDRAALYRNNLNRSNYITIRPVTDESNSGAVGLKVFTEAISNSGKVLYRSITQYGLGSSPAAEQISPRINIALGSAEKANIKFVFPSGKIQMIREIKPGSYIEVYESSFPEHKFILAMRSLERTVKLMELKRELIKLLLLIAVFVSIYAAFGKTRANVLAGKWYFYGVLAAFYLIMVHMTIMARTPWDTLLPPFSTAVLGALVLYLANLYIMKARSMYVAHYRILEVLGEGGMGKVYKAVNKNDKKVAAIKVLSAELLKDMENRRRFAMEGHLMASIDHPNIVRVYSTGEYNDCGYIAMEYMTGGTLKEYIAANHPLKTDRMLQIICQLCDAIGALHKKEIIHRDIKSTNIMLDGAGNVKIMDFGLSKSPLSTTITSFQGKALGTLGYASPEQITNVNVDHRSDIFSLGVVIYELLTSTLPFTGENEMALIHSIFNYRPLLPSAVNPVLPPEIDPIVIKCLEKSPFDRYKDTEQLKNALETIREISYLAH